ncbi:hypothetical protein DBL07_25885 [Achromobacter mucicolens]|uniref:hypothetical protein n=1 Tax=Achromobacter mucicolens TaxID=1389922 RepID=UPI000D4A9342|nr:hypothetical protein [Achromobacter mucicolens]PTW84005.1 hypothetical protein DBL07_25885 [Achromobacter mucicolens]
MILFRAAPVALAILTTPISAQTSIADDPCQLAGTMARTIMTMRHAGVSFPAARAKINEQMEPIRLPDLVDAMLVEAYDSPRYTGESARKRAVQEFENKWYVGCFKSQQGYK